MRLPPQILVVFSTVFAATNATWLGLPVLRA